MYIPVSEGRAYAERAVSYFPGRISLSLSDRIRSAEGEVNEIRAVAGAEIVLVVSDKSVPTGIVCSREEMRRAVMSLCGNSVYSHSETVKDGYIVTSDGIRAGVCGRAVTEGGRILSVADVSAFVIRIPSRRPGFADELYGIMKRSSFRENVLVFSPPSGGKTTLLRELTAKLSESSAHIRTAVVDTRREISEGLDGHHFFSLSGYPRAKGIEIAERTLSPDVIICDEISGDEDLDAVEIAAGGGAAVVASCHSAAYGGTRIMREAQMRGLFGIFYGVNKTGAGTVRYAGEEPCRAS